MLSKNWKAKQFKHSPPREWVMRDFVNKEDSIGFSIFGGPCAIHSNMYWDNQHLHFSPTSLPLRSKRGHIWPEITMNPRIYLRNEQNKENSPFQKKEKVQQHTWMKCKVIFPMLKSSFSRSLGEKCESTP